MKSKERIKTKEQKLSHVRQMGADRYFCDELFNAKEHKYSGVPNCPICLEKAFMISDLTKSIKE